MVRAEGCQSTAFVMHPCAVSSAKEVEFLRAASEVCKPPCTIDMHRISMLELKDLIVSCRYWYVHYCLIQIHNVLL